ncbi:hypothetical protein RJ639_019606 [Escallonia herrerae]|uniref:EamA domain-containing protein n=1 Tax=Escallonia herrerae TaxID=1293975 RepID=A0AA88VBB3_9ASTE|nr:hypothetical protein RJ639_019606 [Escallonia herrerae]
MAGDLVPFLTMVLLQVGYAGMNITSKLAMDSGMNPFVHVAYRQIFASVFLAPFAYFLERFRENAGCSVTGLLVMLIVKSQCCTVVSGIQSISLELFQKNKAWDDTASFLPDFLVFHFRYFTKVQYLFVLFLAHLLLYFHNICRITLNQITYFVGLKNSTPTIACALTNILPAVTFLLAVPFRLESVGIKSKTGQAKLLGTILCVGGAMLLSFYHGPVVRIRESGIHWSYAENVGSNDQSNVHGNFILGPFLLIASPVSWAVWFIIQARMSDKYPAPYSSSALMCSLASVQCVIIGLCVDHSPAAWSLSPAIRAVSSVYAGIVCSALAFCLLSWCIGRKGPLYVSVFSPLLLVIVAILSWTLLREKLYLGTVAGSVLIVMGLYGVLWGKNNETSMTSYVVNKVMDEENHGVQDELELQLSKH